MERVDIRKQGRRSGAAALLPVPVRALCAADGRDGARDRFVIAPACGAGEGVRRRHHAAGAHRSR